MRPIALWSTEGQLGSASVRALLTCRMLAPHGPTVCTVCPPPDPPPSAAPPPLVHSPPAPFLLLRYTVGHPPARPPSSTSGTQWATPLPAPPPPQVHSVSSSLSASMTQLEEVERALARGDGVGTVVGAGAGAGDYRAHLQETRTYVREDIANNARFGNLLKVRRSLHSSHITHPYITHHTSHITPQHVLWKPAQNSGGTSRHTTHSTTQHAAPHHTTPHHTTPHHTTPVPQTRPSHVCVWCLQVGGPPPS